MTLKDVFAWFLEYGGASYTGYWLMKRFAEWKWLDKMTDAWVRMLSYGVTGSIAALAFLGCIAVGYEALPPGWVAWLEALTPIVLGAILAGQTIHGFKEKNGKK